MDVTADSLVDFVNNPQRRPYLIVLAVASSVALISAGVWRSVHLTTADCAANNTAFEGQSKSAVIADLMREAVARAAAQKRSEAAYRRILKRRLSAPEVSADQARTSRIEGRP